MNSVLRIQQVLAASQGERLPAYLMAMRAGVGTTEICKRASRWVNAGHISRERLKGRGWCYYLTDRQLGVYQLKKALSDGVGILQQGAIDEDGCFDGFGLVVGTEAVPERLKFLRMLKEKTVFADHAVLALIIGDYERTMQLRMQAEKRVEDDRPRPGRPAGKPTPEKGRRAVALPLAQFNGFAMEAVR